MASEIYTILGVFPSAFKSRTTVLHDKEKSEPIVDRSRPVEMFAMCKDETLEPWT